MAKMKSRFRIFTDSGTFYLDCDSWMVDVCESRNKEQRMKKEHINNKLLKLTLFQNKQMIAYLYMDNIRQITQCKRDEKGLTYSFELFPIYSADPKIETQYEWNLRKQQEEEKTIAAVTEEWMTGEELEKKTGIRAITIMCILDRQFGSIEHEHPTKVQKSTAAETRYRKRTTPRVLKL